MVDIVSKEQRSKNMSMIRGKGNKSTELRMVELLKKNKITGWRRHYKKFGKPDFVFLNKKVAIFIDGCFWHGCPKHFSLPKTETEFWSAKIDKNKKRDVLVNKYYKDMGTSIKESRKRLNEKNKQNIII